MKARAVNYDLEQDSRSGKTAAGNLEVTGSAAAECARTRVRRVPAGLAAAVIAVASAVIAAAAAAAVAASAAAAVPSAAAVGGDRDRGGGFGGGAGGAARRPHGGRGHGVGHRQGEVV